MRVLLVEDEQKLTAALSQLLRDHQYAVDIAHDGETGLDLALTNSYDILVLDIMLPNRSGLDIVRSVRHAKLSVPVLLLTAKDTIDDRVAGLDAGADDYLVKPFATEELLARVRALSRRFGKIVGTDALLAGPFSIDFSERILKKHDQNVVLTQKEFQLMELLMRNQGKVLSKELILDRVWGPDAEVIANAVENYVHFLRRKIDEPDRSSYIETVRGIGYLFRV